MNIIGALRVKNECRWIARVIKSLKPMCSYVVIFDDNSTDVTAAVARANGALVLPSPFEGFNETRDKQWLYDWLMRGDVLPVPDWIVMVDGDEILEDGAQAKILEAAQSKTAQAFGFEIVYLWNDEQTRRTDLRTFCRVRPSMFSLRPGARFVSPYANGLHCGNIPAGYNSVTIPGVRLLHLGYLNKDDRIRKYVWYNSIDGGNSHEDFYRHMIIGDTVDLPASAVTKWGGPLKLEPLKP